MPMPPPPVSTARLHCPRRSARRDLLLLPVRRDLDHVHLVHLAPNHGQPYRQL